MVPVGNGGWLYSDQHQVMLCEPDGKPVKTAAFRVKAVTTSQDRIACLGLDGTTRIFDENLALLPDDFETPEATGITLSGEGGLWYFDLGMKLFRLNHPYCHWLAFQPGWRKTGDCQHKWGNPGPALSRR